MYFFPVETFPCKFFHSRNFCIHGDSCRFSHAPLNDESRELLATVLQQDVKQPGASTPVMSNTNSIGDVAQPHPTPQPLMSVDTSAMAPLMGGAAPPLMQQDHPPRPPWDGSAPVQQPPVMMPPPQFGGASGNSGPRQLPEPNNSNITRQPEQKLGILPTPPAYMKLIPNSSQVSAPAVGVNSSVSAAVQDPRSSSDPRMNQQQQHLKRQQESFELNSHGEPSGDNNTSAGQSKEDEFQTDNGVSQQADGILPLFQPLEPPKELSKQKPHFIPDLPSPAVGVIDNVDASLPSHIARPGGVSHHSIDQSPSRPRNLKSKYSHLKVKSRTSKSATPTEEQSLPLTTRRSKSILKRTVEKPKEPFSMYSQDDTEDNNILYGEIQPVFSNRTKATSKEEIKSSNSEKASSDSDKTTATKKDSSVPYYAMFDTGFGSDLQIDSAFGSLED